MQVRSNSTTSVLQTAIDCAYSAAKAISHQLTACEIVPEASQIPNQLQINSKSIPNQLQPNSKLLQLAACKTRILSHTLIQTRIFYLKARHNSMNRFPNSFAIVALALGALAAHGRAATITVCPDGSCNFTDPVAAIAAAIPNDIIEIHAGTYMLGSTISITGAGLAGKPLVIRGAVDESGHPTTVLNAGGTKQVFSLVALDATTSFENLVITNGRGDYGGAVFTYGANVVFQNCAFRSNRANFRAGAIYLNDSSPMLIDCEFTDNLASNTQGAPQAVGGAIYVGNNTLTLTRCSFTANASNYYGGALFLTNGGQVILQSTRICGNSSPNGPQIGMSSGGIVTDLGGVCISDNCDDCPVCLGDFNNDGLRNGADLTFMLSAWGTAGGDLNGDGVTNGVDLATMLSGWGACG